MGNKPNLEDITLISITSVNIQSAANALVVSNAFYNFSSVKLLSSQKPKTLNSAIEHIPIPPISNIANYSKFMVEELHKYIDTKFCLVIQADGFVINPELWSNDFLQYDYIGSPWPTYVETSKGIIHFDNNRVGNGGFSLRSKKFLEICSQINFDVLNTDLWPEDMLMCHFLYEDFLNSGAQFAPIEIASKFSIEGQFADLDNSLSTSFGFHGKHWLTNEYLAGLAASSNYPEEFWSLLLPQHSPLLTKNLNRIGRLEPCPCGSNKRFKDCHGRIA